MSTFTIIGTIIVPIILRNISEFHFVILPAKFYLIVLALVFAYAVITQFVKRLYIKKYHEWI